VNREPETLSVVVAGHKDHGKSTLLGRLLLDSGQVPRSCRTEVSDACVREGREFQPAFLIDRLLDERRGGLTLCAGRATLRRGHRLYELIDPPGHHELVREMVMGATTADAAIMVVDVGEGVAEQTRRHAAYLHAIGLNQLIVVVNKMDLVDFRVGPFRQLVSSLTSLLQQVELVPLHTIPASTLAGENIVQSASLAGWYSGPTVCQALEELHRIPASSHPLRFPVQDVYRVKGKEMLVGRVESGTMRPGDEVVLLPGGLRRIIHSLHRYEKELDVAGAGESIGLRLQRGGSCSRGTVICAYDTQPVVTQRFRAQLLWTNERPVQVGSALTLRCTTQEAKCCIDSIESILDTDSLASEERRDGTLCEYEIGMVTIRCERPLAIEAYLPSVALGRFVLERDGRVVAGGLVSQEAVGEFP